MLKMAIVIASFGLAGCAPEMRASAIDECVELGSPSGSPEFTECRALENEKRARFGAALVGAMQNPPLPTDVVLGMGHG